MLDMIHYKKFPFTELHRKLLCSEKPSRNSCHESKTSNRNLPSCFINIHFCIIFKSVWGSIVSTMTRIYTGRSGALILAEARELPHLHNIQTISSAHPASNSIKTTVFSLAVKWPEQTVWTLSSIYSQVYESVELNLHSTCLPPWHILGQIYFTSTSYLCIYLSRGHILSGLIKEPFYTLLIPYVHTTWSI